MTVASPKLINTLDINRLTAESAADGSVIAVAMLVTAVHHLVFVGGIDATVELLHGTILDVRAGAYPEPAHAAGNA